MSRLRGVRLIPFKQSSFILFAALLFGLSPLSVFAQNWQAEFKVRVLSPKHKTIHFTGKIYTKEAKVRLEALDSDEIDLYDFETETETRIFPKDQIYFVKPLALAKKIKGLKEAWAPVRAPFFEKRVFLNDGEVQGQPAKLYLVILEREGQKVHLFRWLSADEAQNPLRVIYSGSGHETIIVDYLHLDESVSPNEFDPPKNYLSLSPY